MTEGALSRLRRLLLDRSVRRGDFVLASGQRSSYYIDCRLTTMSAEGQGLIGELGWQAIRAARWHPRAVGGLTMGADPVAYAVAAASLQAATGLLAAFITTGPQRCWMWNRFQLIAGAAERMPL